MRTNATERLDGAGNRERGAALIVTMVSVMVAASLSLALLLVAVERKKTVESRRFMESALAVAEAGLARAQAEANLPVNRANRHYPAPGPAITLTGTSAELRNAENSTAVVGRYVVTLLSGMSDGKDNDGDGQVDEDDHDPRDILGDGIDNDGDGLVDAADNNPADPENPGENNYIIITSLGYHGPATEGNPFKVKVTGQIFAERNVFSVFGALSVGGPSPAIDLGNSNAFDISGWDHDDDSDDVYAPGDTNDNGDPTPGLPGISVVDSTIGDPTGTLQDGIDNGQVDGTSPTAFDQPSNDLTKIVAWAKANATFTTPGQLPGNFDYSNVTYHEGNQTVNGNLEGAGIWVVNGDLEYGGNCNFRGIMIVTGNCTVFGGGGDYLLKGALIVGGNAAVDFTNNGTTDIRYSSEAVTNAQNAGVYYVMQAWLQIPVGP